VGFFKHEVRLQQQSQHGDGIHVTVVNAMLIAGAVVEREGKGTELRVVALVAAGDFLWFPLGDPVRRVSPLLERFDPVIVFRNQTRPRLQCPVDVVDETSQPLRLEVHERVPQN
jgi:hypothetical protein